VRAQARPSPWAPRLPGAGAAPQRTRAAAALCARRPLPPPLPPLQLPARCWGRGSSSAASRPEPELNGARGRCVSFLEATGRYGVRVEPGGKEEEEEGATAPEPQVDDREIAGRADSGSKLGESSGGSSGVSSGMTGVGGERLEGLFDLKPANLRPLHALGTASANANGAGGPVGFGSARAGLGPGAGAGAEECALCGRSAASRCKACLSVAYCGAACQHAHWKAHKSACRENSKA
jgi:hypothetical protein